MTDRTIPRPIGNNIEGLETRLYNNRSKLTTSTRGKIRDVIQLYKDRRIAQFETASNMVNELIRARTDKDKQKANTKYQNMMEQYEERQPLNERMRQSRQENIQTGAKKENNYALELHFFTTHSWQSGGFKVAFYDSQRNRYYPTTRNKLYARVKTTKYIEEQVKKRINRSDDLRTFKKVVKILSEDDDIATYLHTKNMIQYIDGIIIYSADIVDGNPKDQKPEERNLRHAQNIGVYNRYVQTKLDTDCATFEEAIKVKHYIQNECWINALNDFYGDEPRMKKLTRVKVLELIGKTDEEFNSSGASINDMAKVFREYSISARLFDCMNNAIYCYDPPKTNHHIKSFFGLIKNDHIYTMDRDIKTLKANLGINKEYTLDVKASTDFHINTRDEPIECRMIESIDDFLKYTEKDEYTMIYNGNDLSKLYCKSKQAGYNPHLEKGKKGNQIQGQDPEPNKFNQCQYNSGSGEDL